MTLFNRINYKYLFPAFLLLCGWNMAGALRLEPIKYGNMENWYTRDITESGLIGGATKRIYEIAPNGHTSGNKPYRNLGGSPWATSNVYAKVSGIVKGSNAVEPVSLGGSKMA